jgi:hypothetical protein
LGLTGTKPNAERFARLRERMEADYWSLLASRFRQFVLDSGVRDKHS